MESRIRAKTRDTSVKTEPRLRHEKPCLETVSRQDTRLDTPSLNSHIRAPCIYAASVGLHKRLRNAVECGAVCMSETAELLVTRAHSVERIHPSRRIEIGTVSLAASSRCVRASEVG